MRFELADGRRAVADLGKRVLEERAAGGQQLPVLIDALMARSRRVDELAEQIEQIEFGRPAVTLTGRQALASLQARAR